MSENELLQERKVVAEYKGLTAAWLRRKRLDHRGPPFLRIGRMIRYRRSDLETWLNERRIEPREVQGR